MYTKSEIISELIQKRRHLKNDFCIRKIGVFGSVAKETNTPQSDIDLLIEFNQAIGLLQFAKLKLELTDLFGQKVDLVTPKALKPILKENVMREVEWVEGF